MCVTDWRTVSFSSEIKIWKLWKGSPKFRMVVFAEQPNRLLDFRNNKWIYNRNSKSAKLFNGWHFIGGTWDTRSDPPYPVTMPPSRSIDNIYIEQPFRQGFCLVKWIATKVNPSACPNRYVNISIFGQMTHPGASAGVFELVIPIQYINWQFADISPMSIIDKSMEWKIQTGEHEWISGWALFFFCLTFARHIYCLKTPSSWAKYTQAVPWKTYSPKNILLSFHVLYCIVPFFRSDFFFSALFLVRYVYGIFIAKQWSQMV